MTLLQEKPDQIEKENEKSGTKLDQDRSLTPSIVKEELTTLKGVGPRIKEVLNSAGISSIVQLTKMTDTNLIQLGIGQATAKKIIAGAKEHIHKSNLDVYAHNKEIIDVKTIESEPVILNNDPFYNTEIKQVEDIGTSYTYTEIEDNEYEENIEEENQNEIKYEPRFEEKFNYSSFTESREFKNATKENLNKEKQDRNYIQEKNEQLLNQKCDGLEISIENHQSKISSQENYSALERLYKKVRSADFSIIEKTNKLRPLFVEIDAIAVKIVRVKEFLDIICIIPIIISKMEGKFTVSEGFIEYTPANENENHFQTKKQANSYITSLKKAEESIFNDLTNNGVLLHYITKFLDINISSERTITHKMLFLHSGPVQYEVLIEPIIVCQNSVGFTEKLIPFAYIREMNIHIVPLSQVPDLLSYLDQKYFFIETYSEKQNAFILNNKAETNFMKEIRLVSVPFTLYGFIFLLIFLFQGFSILSLLINIGYGVVSLYIIVVGYIYLKLTQQKKEIKQQFAVPYYMRDLGLNDDRLNLIRQQFTPKLMEQFGYEILGKGSNSVLMEKVEQENAKNYLADKIMKRQLEESKLFEEQTTNYSDSPRPNISPEAIDKYSSFLED